MSRGRPGDVNDLEATTHAAWQDVSARWVSVCCAGLHREIAPERSTDDVEHGVQCSTVSGCVWYRGTAWNVDICVFICALMRF